MDVDVDNFNLLNQRVDLLKKDIQEIIDNYKVEPNKENREKLKVKKALYLEELDSVLSNIKEINKKERQKTSRENEIKKAIRNNDSMKYYSVKNKPNTIELMNEQKANREKAKVIYEKKSKLKEDYNNLESELNCQEYPAFLFFDRDISEKYKLCKFIELNETSLKDRKEWLESRYDKGELYYNLYNKLINKESLNILISQKKDIEKYFEEIHDSLDYESKKTLQKINEYLKEYKAANVKTKKLKEKFNIIINNTSIIVKKGIKINEYLSLYHDIIIPINNIVECKNDKNEIISLDYSRIYDDKLEEYSKNKEEIQSVEKFIFNTTNNLNQELYDYLYKKSNDKKIIRQEGKYFKKWTELSKEEKIDRFESYAEYFTKKYLLEPSIITDVDKISSLITELKLLITEEFERIKYKNLKWSIVGGVIENINCLKYDNEKKCFFLTAEKKIEKNEKKNATKKVSSIRTILNKDTNKIINEELMKYLIIAKKQEKLSEENKKVLKEKFIDKIKEKLKLKRVMINDRNEINKIFDDIFNIIYSHNSDNISMGSTKLISAPTRR